VYGRPAVAHNLYFQKPFVFPHISPLLGDPKRQEKTGLPFLWQTRSMLTTTYFQQTTRNTRYASGLFFLIFLLVKFISKFMLFMIITL
jgi:hypothetical protein